MDTEPQLLLGRTPVKNNRGMVRGTAEECTTFSNPGLELMSWAVHDVDFISRFFRPRIGDISRNPYISISNQSLASKPGIIQELLRDISCTRVLARQQVFPSIVIVLGRKNELCLRRGRGLQCVEHRFGDESKHVKSLYSWFPHH